MMLKKLKKQSVLQLTALLLAAAIAIVAGACPDDAGGSGEDEKEKPINISDLNWGASTQADVKTLGLTPGNNTTELMLNWYSDGAPSGKVAHVRFIRGTLAQAFELIEVKTGTSVVDAKGNNAAEKTAHKAKVTGLRPGASYVYAVSSDGINWSNTYNYTAPAAGAFKFAVIADPQLTQPATTAAGLVDTQSRYPAKTVTTAAGWAETMAKIVAAGVNFIASGGDQVDKTGDGDETEYENFFAPDGLRSLPFAPVPGNHDRHLPFVYHYNLPNEQDFSSETGIMATEFGYMGNYFYLYNNVLFVVLNTAPYPTSTTQAEPFIERFGQVLTTAKAAHAGKYDWLIVQHHKSTASVADHIADRDIQYYVEAGFETLMSTHKVDFVLAGHDHVYARSYPLAGKGGGQVSVPDKTKASTDGHTYASAPGNPIYLTFTTGSGLKYYGVSVDKTIAYGQSLPGMNFNNLYVKDSADYPYLGTTTDGTSSTAKGSVSYSTAPGMLPVSNHAWEQPYIPSYCIAEVNGKTIKFSTYAIKTISGYLNATAGDWTGTAGGDYEQFSFDENTPYDWVQVTKQ